MSAALEDMLRRRLAEFRERIAAIESELRRELDDDSPDQAIDREDDEPLEATERVLRAEVDAVELALARLRSGDYGHCVACGEPIAAARLEALPATSLCLPCASKGSGPLRAGERALRRDGSAAPDREVRR
jgi:RNA polymerase-binding transcription factor DksA